MYHLHVCQICLLIIVSQNTQRVTDCIIPFKLPNLNRMQSFNHTLWNQLLLKSCEIAMKNWLSLFSWQFHIPWKWLLWILHHEKTVKVSFWIFMVFSLTGIFMTLKKYWKALQPYTYNISMESTKCKYVEYLFSYSFSLSFFFKFCNWYLIF